jgi:hypothetical protein
LRRAMGEPGLPTRRKNTPKLIRTGGSVETDTPAELERRDPLAHVLEWAKQQSSTTPATGNRSRKAKRAAPQIAEHSPLD